MGILWQAIGYLQDNPGTALFFVALLAWIYYLLNRKSKLSRELDERMEQLRQERGDYYRGIRPPK